MWLEESQMKSKGAQQPQRIPWVCAVVSISFLSACFISTCLVTHYFLHWKRGSTLKFSDYHTRLTCILEEPQPGATGGTWTCCPVSWRAFQSNCYFPLNDNQTWHESERNCSGMSSHLVTINTEAEQEEGQWQWVDKTPFNPNMVFWKVGEPNDYMEEDCVVLVYDQDKWVWNDFPCHFEMGRICKLPGATFDWNPSK